MCASPSDNFAMTPLLTIAIPTYNRSRYLAELLPEIIRQSQDEDAGKLEILVLDNASTDGTQALVEGQRSDSLRYVRNPENIGADRNFIKCVEMARGRYVWLFGDDEILRPQGIRRVLTRLQSSPEFLIVDSDLDQSGTFASYRQLLDATSKRDPIFPVHHTLITRNVFPKDGFDLDVARKNLPTSYCHMYAVLNHLVAATRIVVLSKHDSVITVRDVRPAFAEPPSGLDRKLIQLNRSIAEALHYPRLGTDVWLYYRARPLYKLRHSRKVRRLLDRLCGGQTQEGPSK